MGFGKTKYKEFTDFDPGKGGSKIWFKAAFPGSGQSTRYRVRILPPTESNDTGFPAISAPLHYWANFGEKRPEGVTPGVSAVVKKKDNKDLASEIYFALKDFFDNKSPEHAALLRLAPQTRIYVGLIHKATDKTEIPVENQIPQIFSMTYPAWDGFKKKFDIYVEAGTPLDDLSDKGHDMFLYTNGGPPKKYTWDVDPAPSAVGLDLDFIAENAVDLQAEAFKNQLTQEQCSEWVRPVLGEFYDTIVAAYEKQTGIKLTATIPDTEDLGEAV